MRPEEPTDHGFVVSNGVKVAYERYAGTAVVVAVVKYLICLGAAVE